jgi:ribonuclease HI
MARPLRIYVTAVSATGHSRGPWKAVLLAENSSGNVISEAAYSLRSQHGGRGHPADPIEASLSAILMALVTGRKHRARDLIVYSDSPAAVDIMNKRRNIATEAIGTYLQARALAHSYRTVSFYYSPYPAISDAPVIAAGG